MQKITLTQIQNLDEEEHDFLFLDYSTFSLKVKTKLEAYELKSYIETIVNSSFIGLTYSPVLYDIMREIMFLKTFVVNDENNGIEISDEIEDLYELYNIIKKLNIVEKALAVDTQFYNYFDKIEKAITQCIEDKKQQNYAYISQSSANTEAIEATTTMLAKFGKALDTANAFLEKNSGVLNKLLTPKKIKELFSKFETIGISNIANKAVSTKNSDVKESTKK